MRRCPIIVVFQARQFVSRSLARSTNQIWRPPTGSLTGSARDDDVER
jgi:hypothetical protein